VKTEAAARMKTRASLVAAAMPTVNGTGTVIAAVSTTTTVAMVVADNSSNDG